jgi:ElaB/YqjD/DUF883 family membrane-anchored ribosome-binding protein
MRNLPTDATTEELQRRASDIRANIDRTLLQLEDQLQSDRLMQTVSTQLRVSGSALAMAAGRAVMRHPKPMVAVGAAVLLYSLARRRRRARPHRQTSSAIRGMQNVGRFAQGIMEAARLVNNLRRGGL